MTLEELQKFVFAKRLEYTTKAITKEQYRTALETADTTNGNDRIKNYIKKTLEELWA
jgi:hypothetical protein